jgi:hypothetical protein
MALRWLRFSAFDPLFQSRATALPNAQCSARPLKVHCREANDAHAGCEALKAMFREGRPGGVF